MKHYYNRKGKIVNIQKLPKGWTIDLRFTNEHGATYANVYNHRGILVSVLKYGTKEEVMSGTKGWEK